MNTASQHPAINLGALRLKEGKTYQQIHEELVQSGIDSDQVNELMKHIKDERYEAQRKKGIPLIAIGVALCVVGCIATVVISDTGTGFNFCLYGLTSIGATSIVGGLAFILG